MTVLVNQGNGTFVSTAGPVIAPVSNTQQVSLLSVALTDVNGDGKADLVVRDVGGPRVLVFLGNGDGTFQAPISLATDFTVLTEDIEGLGVNLLVTDLNGDGHPDILVANGGDIFSRQLGTINVFLGHGDGTFTPGATLQSSVPGLFAIAVADTHGNGIPDILATELGDVVSTGIEVLGNIDVFVGHGDGTFFSPISVASVPNPQQIAVGDLDGDGNVDLVVTQNSSPVLGVLKGNGNGTFQAPLFFAAGASVNAGLEPTPMLAIADTRRHGLPDIIVGGAGLQLSTMLHR